jgi:hypothetical protein
MTSTMTALPRADHRIAGIAGLAGVVLLGGFISLMSTPDVTADNATSAINTWLHGPSATAHLHVALALGALSYVFLLVFAGAVHRIARTWDPAGSWSSVALAGFALFLAGAIASDAFELAIPLSLDSTHGLTPDASLVAVFDRGWLIALTEGQVAFAVAIGAVTVAAIRARQRGEHAPLALIVLGIVAVAAVIPMLAGYTVPVFIASNLLRLLWIIATSIWMIRRPGEQPQSADATSDGDARSSRSGPDGLHHTTEQKI